MGGHLEPARIHVGDIDRRRERPVGLGGRLTDLLAGDLEGHGGARVAALPRRDDVSTR